MKSKLRVVIDTNIFIKGWFAQEDNNNSKSAINIMELIDNRKLYLLFSQETIGELVYLMKNFVRYNIDDVSIRLQMLNMVMREFYYGTSINTIPAKNNKSIEKSKDEFDDIFVECAVQGNADYIISNDYKSGMHNLKNIKTVDSKEFIDIYNRLQNVAMGE